MKKHTIVLFSIVATSSICAQEVISTQGESYSNATCQVDFTVGEVVIDTGSDGTNEITQGFHQTNWNFLGLEDHSSDYLAFIFPNPTVDGLNIRTEVFEGVTYKMYDASGRIVMENLLTSSQTSLQVTLLAPGHYSIVLIKDQKDLKTFKLIKAI